VFSVVLELGYAAADVVERAVTGWLGRAGEIRVPSVD
jgi:hypothetical protein